jgi:hypothetical protein
MLVTHFSLRTSSRFQSIFWPLGFPAKVSSNSEAVLDAAREEWGAWRQAFDDPAIELHFEVADGESALYPSKFQTQAHRFTITADAHNRASGDTRARTAEARISSTTAANAPHLVYHFLDAMAYALITSLALTPIHAGCVARDGRGVLLGGDSGAGKSSLAYACARSGWTFVSDDASPLLRRDAAVRTVLGGPHSLRFRPEARELFPELARFTPAIRGNRKLSLPIHSRDLPIATATSAHVDAVVLLRRTAGSSARLESIDKAQVLEHCAKWFYSWDPPVYAEQLAAFEVFLAGVRVFSLVYSDLDSAVKSLDDAA